MKTCSACLIEKDISCFSKGKGVGGKRSKCKQCISEYNSSPEVSIKNKDRKRKYRSENKDNILRYAKDYQKRNSEYIASYQKEYRTLNAGKISAQKKEYAACNKDRMALLKKAYSISNREHKKEYDKEYYLRMKGVNKALANYRLSRYRAAKRMATPTWSNWLDALLVKEQYIIAETLSVVTGIPHQVDHIIPLVSNKVCGLHTVLNLQVITAKENQSKNNRIWPNQ